MAFLHPIDLRMRCTLQTLHQILVLILEYSSKSHKDAVTKNDPDVALAEIIKNNYNEFKKKKLLQEPHYKHFFYDDSSLEKDGLRESIIIKSLDFGVVCIIIKSSKLTSFKKCCNECRHKCTKCNVEHLKNWKTETGDCNYKSCIKCNTTNKDCNYVKFLLFATICRALRNTSAHITEDLCKDFEAGRKKFENFPDSDKWSKIWDVVNKAALDCLDFLKKEKHIEEKVYKDYEMDLRIAYSKDSNFLIPIVGNYLDCFRKLIIGEAEMTEHMNRIETCLREGKVVLFFSFVTLLINYIIGEIFRGDKFYFIFLPQIKIKMVISWATGNLKVLECKSLQ